jgi:DsbC/DsbD-like thiol-disulfide interchange protein
VIGPALDLATWLSVSARVEPARLRPGERGRLVVEVTVPEGCHVESHDPSEPWLIPTVLGVEAPEGIAAGEVAYPESEERTFDWSPAVLRVYRGTFELSAPVKVGLGASPGSVAVLARLSYQGCTESICLMPSEQAAEARLEIATE